MLSYFPLFTLASRYLWSRRDPLIFWMHQFALWCLMLTMGLMFALFSIMNGVEERVEAHTRPFYGDVLITHQDLDASTNNDMARLLEFLRHRNQNMPTGPSIRDGVLEKVRAQNTFLKTKNGSIGMVIVERCNTFARGLHITADIAETSKIDVYDIEQYNPMFGSFRHKQFPVVSVIASGSRYIRMGLQDYDAFFKLHDHVTAWRLFHRDYSPEWLDSIKKQVPSGMMMYESRRMDANKLSAIQFQKNIFTLVYAVLFVLMTAIMLAVNVAFFKDKRKDWALLSMMPNYQHPVAKVFFYKNMMTLTMAIMGGSLIGYGLARYANDIIQGLLRLQNKPFEAQFFFGETSIPYRVYFSDWALLCGVMTGMMVINTLTLAYLFKRESRMQLLKMSS